MSEKPTSKRQNIRGKFLNKKRGPRSVAEIVGKVLEPVMAKRAGMTLDLLNAWPELVGDEFRETTRPEKINWPRKSNEDDPFKPAVLVVACENSVALFFQHEQSLILERVNVFFGFEAIERITILQKAVIKVKSEKFSKKSMVTKVDELRLETIVNDIEDPKLKATLTKLGRGVIAKSTK